MFYVTLFFAGPMLIVGAQDVALLAVANLLRLPALRVLHSAGVVRTGTEVTCDKRHNHLF